MNQEAPPSSAMIYDPKPEPRGMEKVFQSGKERVRGVVRTLRFFLQRNDIDEAMRVSCGEDITADQAKIEEGQQANLAVDEKKLQSIQVPPINPDLLIMATGKGFPESASAHSFLNDRWQQVGDHKLLPMDAGVGNLFPDSFDVPLASENVLAEELGQEAGYRNFFYAQQEAFLSQRGHSQFLINLISKDWNQFGADEAKFITRSLRYANNESTAGLLSDAIGKLGDPLNTDEVNDGALELLLGLIDNGFAEQIAQKIQAPIGLGASLQRAGLLVALVEKGHQGQLIWARMPDQVDFSGSTLNECNLFSALIEAGLSKEFCSRYSMQVDVEDASQMHLILARLVNLGQSEKVLEWINPSIDITRLPTSSWNLLLSLVASGKLKQLLSKFVDGERLMRIVDAVQSDPDALNTMLLKEREGVLLSSDEIPNRQIGPTVEEMISHFPIDISTIRTVTEWHTAKLRKDGSDSRIWWRANHGGDDLRLVFHTSNMTENSLEQFRRARQLIPSGTCGSNYPELDKGRSEDYFYPYTGGFREVFAGQTLGSLWGSLDALPEQISTSIRRQYELILLALMANGIDHGHPHRGNFNVRFLLENHSGERQIFFDATEAMKEASHRGAMISPIVVIRDFGRVSKEQESK